MADKTISSLPAATTVDDSSLWVAENQGQAQKVTGAQIKGFAQAAVQQYVSQAQQAAQEAQEAVTQIGTAVDDTEANAQAAQEAKEAAETAQGLAETAKTEAEAAASGVAEDAQAAEQAKNAAVTAQGAAEGARDTAQGYATSASESAATATQKAEEAAGSAVDAAQSAASIEGDVEAAQTAATQAAGSASAAAGSASAAADSASDAAGSATAASESATAASGSAQAAASSASAALQSETSAETAASNAAQSETNASDFASAASESATAAAGSASTASQAASGAQSAQTLAETAQAGAEDAETGAEAARDAILNMLVEAITLETGKPATVTKSLVDQVYKLTFGLPKGDTGNTGAPGPQGVSVESIQLTSGNHAPGTTDTYTITLSDDSTFQFTVYNGANGAGAGDFMADGSVPMTGPLDMNGNRVTEVGTPTADTDAANKVYVDEALEGMTITTDATPTEDSTNPVQSGGVFDALSNKQDTLSGTEDQLVGFNSAGEATAVAKPIYTATDVGAMPAVSGGTTGQVLTKTEEGQEWQNAPDGLPPGGEEGQVLTKTASGAQWDDVPSDLPSGGTDGQILTKTDDGVAWENPPDTGVTTFNGRKGAVSPGADDYSASMIKFTDGHTFQQKYDSGELVGPPGQDGATGADGATGPAGADATINGVNALTIEGSGKVTATQSGSTLTLDTPNAVQVPGGGNMQMASGLGNAPYTIEFTEDEDAAVAASQVSYANSGTGMTATNVQAALSELNLDKQSESQVNDLISAALAGFSGGGVKVETGTYTGTGTSGSSNKNIIYVNGTPVFLILYYVNGTSVDIDCAGYYSSNICAFPWNYFFAPILGVNTTGTFQVSESTTRGSLFLSVTANSIQYYTSSGNGSIQYNKTGMKYGYIVFCV